MLQLNYFGPFRRRVQNTTPRGPRMGAGRVSVCFLYARMYHMKYQSQQAAKATGGRSHTKNRGSYRNKLVISLL